MPKYNTPRDNDLITNIANIRSRLTRLENRSVNTTTTTANALLRTDLAYVIPSTIDRTGATDVTSAIQSAADQAYAAGALLYMPPGTYKVSSIIVIKGDADLSQATFNYTPTGAGNVCVLVGNSAIANFRCTVALPKIVNTMKAGLGWAQTGVVGSTGVRVVNCYNWLISFEWITGFEIGLDVRGQSSQGTSYCTFLMGHLDNNKQNHILSADSTGWSNQNTYIGGRLSHNSNEGSIVTGTRQVIITTGLANRPNNNVWLNTSLEGNVAEYHIDLAGLYNRFINNRFETGVGGVNGRVLYRADATDNLIDQGFGTQLIVPTRTAGELRNSIKSSSLWEQYGSANGHIVRLQNSFSNVAPALSVFDASSVANADWTWQLTANELQARRKSDTFLRAKFDGINGRFYAGGTGTSADPVGYYGGSQSLLFVGGGLPFGPLADNTQDNGIASLRWRDGWFGRNVAIDGTLTVGGARLTPESRVTATQSTAGTLTADMTSGANIFEWTLASTGIQIGSPTDTNQRERDLVIFLVQDATGSRTVTWSTAFAWQTGSAPTLKTAAAAVDVFQFRYGGGKWQQV